MGMNRHRENETPTASTPARGNRPALRRAYASHWMAATIGSTLVLGALSLAALTAEAKLLPTTARPDLVWPPPPDPARIAFLQSFDQPVEFGAKLSPLTRFANWVGGGDKGNERLIKPFGIALDDDGNLCLTDTGANTVSLFQRAERKWYRWEKVGRVRFASPVAVAKKGNRIYVADSALGAVIGFDLKGKVQCEIRQHLMRPAGLAIVGERLYVADAQRHAMVSFDLSGRYLSEFGRRGAGPGELNYPTHVAADAKGHLLVTDTMNSRIQRFTPDGQSEGVLGSAGDAPGHFGRPKGVAADLAGRIYVLDGLADNFQIFDPAGRLLLCVGGSGTGAGQFWMPNGIAISRDLDIYVADSYNRRVQVFKYVGPP